MQPIVENSIHHGLEDGGCINVVIDRIEDKYLMISIKDNGQGLTQQEINQILNQESHHANQIGIGLNYVKTMLNSYFEGDAQFRMESEMDIGTTVTLIVPIILD
ncbi:two-component sensor histidine kinase [Gracilibacillus boraciitolerans JCM 21714]|uniref:histidine kinase n=1 Tax=Gracilibacillus boraciitolerans JCM 21714 TaxID=1298598 RepID=W4VMD3_9BACI|nr:ATP-binding protein [Gracilibacillus boraciitolerans]GAE94372.1 two-component sensor histidine kinase [Gracilibacillus boraciitolerans JCM 21714]